MIADGNDIGSDDDFDPATLVSKDFVVVTFEEMWADLALPNPKELKRKWPQEARRRGHIVREFTDEL